MSGIALLGDIAVGGILSRDPSLIDAGFFILGRQLGTYDKVIANLEFPVEPENLELPGDYFHYTSPEATSKIIKSLHLSVLSLANNHMFDLGHEGLYQTIQLLKREGVLFTGAGYLPEHLEPVHFEISGRRFGFMAFVDEKTNPKKTREEGLHINSLDYETLPGKITDLKKQVDYVILSIHWGNDYSYFPTGEQVTNAKKMIASGADIIMGHHPHTIQPFERIGDAYVFYSLGQVCFGDFLWEGKLRAIRKKTKKGFYPVFSEDLILGELVSFKEKKGNEVQFIKRNIARWSRRKLKQASIKHRWPLANALFNFREGILDRIWEFLFGYYRNPIAQLFDAGTYKKGTRIGRYYQYLKKNN
jgi:hypothetical protein